MTDAVIAHAVREHRRRLLAGMNAAQLHYAYGRQSGPRPKRAALEAFLLAHWTEREPAIRHVVDRWLAFAFADGAAAPQLAPPPPVVR